MILADPSLWVQHFRRGLPDFAAALSLGKISIHPVALGGLALGNLSNRERTLATLRSLPRAKVGSADECLGFVEAQQLYGRGIGWADVQLLAAPRLCGDRLWSLDSRFVGAANQLGIAYRAP